MHAASPELHGSEDLRDLNSELNFWASFALARRVAESGAVGAARDRRPRERRERRRECNFNECIA